MQCNVIMVWNWTFNLQLISLISFSNKNYHPLTCVCGEGIKVKFGCYWYVAKPFMQQKGNICLVAQCDQWISNSKINWYFSVFDLADHQFSRDNLPYSSFLGIWAKKQSEAMLGNISLTFAFVGSGLSTSCPGIIFLTTLFRVGGNT